MSKVIAVTSGKGGVGKTNISVNLAVKLARLNHKVCLFDADLGLANINILLGLTPDYTLEDVLNGEKKLSDIILKGSNIIDIIPGSSGVEIMTDQSQTELNKFIGPLSAMDNYDYIFFDTSAGISRHVIAFCMASGSIILTVIPEPTSFTDSYALLKVLCRNGFKGRVDVIINRCKTTHTARKIYVKFQETVSKYLKVDLNYLGSVVEDPQVSEAVTGQQPFIDMFPGATSSSCIRDIASKFLENMEDYESMTIQSFWTSFVQRMKSPSNSKEKALEIETKPTIAEEQNDTEINTAGANDRAISKDISEKFLEALDAIVKNTASISMELSALRNVIEKKESVPVATVPVTIKKPAPDSPAIKLDFEKFLIDRRTSKQEVKTSS